MVLLDSMVQEDLAYLLGAFQVQTFFGRELVLASSVDPFVDGSQALVLLEGASWALRRQDREVGSNQDNHQEGHHQILVGAYIEVAAVAAAVDQLRHRQLRKKLLLLLLVAPVAVGRPVEEVAFPRMVPQDIVDALA